MAKPRLLVKTLTSETQVQSLRAPTWLDVAANSILQSLKVKDDYTYGHCLRVSRYARILAKAAGLSPDEQTLVEYTSVFHDVGKIGISELILNKPGRLTVDEEGEMQKHAVMSENLVASLLVHSSESERAFIEAILPGIRHHHERIDGNGYPDQIKGDAIPFFARITLIADTFDAMTSSRPYRRGLPVERAFAELKKYSGTQFDPELARVFLAAIESEFNGDETVPAIFEHGTWKTQRKSAA